MVSTEAWNQLVTEFLNPLYHQNMICLPIPYTGFLEFNCNRTLPILLFSVYETVPLLLFYVTGAIQK
jgi:hypothetical protein